MQSISKAARFISAGDVKTVVFEPSLQFVNDPQDFQIIRLNFPLKEQLWIAFELWLDDTKCVICTMDIHPDFYYSIHSDLLLYAVNPQFAVFAIHCELYG